MTELAELRRARLRRGQRNTPPRRQAPAGPAAQPASGGLFRLDGSVSPSAVGQLQGVIGNAAVSRQVAAGSPVVQRLWGRKKPTDSDLKELKQKAGHQRNVTGNQVEKVPESHGFENAQEGVGFGAELTGVPGDALSNYGSSTTRLDGEEIAFTDETGQAGLSAAGAGLGGFGSMLTGVGGGIGVLLAVKKLKELSQSTDPGAGWDKAATWSVLIGSGAQGLIGGAQTVAGLTGAGANAAAAAGHETGKAVADAASGVMDSLGALGGLVEMGVSGMQVVSGIAKIIKGGWDPEAASNVGVDFLKGLKGAAVTAKSIVSAANTWLTIAGQAVAVLPVVGAAINIVAQMVDIAIQLVDMAMRVYKLVKGAIMASKMRALEAAKSAGSQVGQFAAGMAINAKKRWQRQIAPLVGNVVNVIADFISIGGSVLNIIGVATAAAYGAGVGIMAAGYAANATAGVMKVGSALIKPTQAFARWGKQKIRDKAAGNQNSRLYKAGKKVGINMDKTTNAKNREIADQISFLMHHLHGLRDLPAPTDSSYGDIRTEYEEAHLLVKSTGVKVKDLTAATDATRVVEVLATALRSRE